MNTVLALLPHSQAASQVLQCFRLLADNSVTREVWTQDALQAHKGTQCIVVVPATCLSWPQTTLPEQLKLRSDARLVTVLQSLVEETLLDDAEAMHLALAPDAQPGAALTMAACNKAWLAHWLQALEQAGIKVLRVIPEVAPDVMDGKLWVCGSEHDVWVTGLKGSAVLTVPLEAAAPVFGSSTAVHARASVYTLASQQLGADRTHLCTDAQWLQTQLQTQWNLAQHMFAGTWHQRMRRRVTTASETFFHAREWRAVRVACITLGVGLALVLNVQALRQGQALQQQRETIVQTVQQTFPQLRVVIDAPLQMQRELERLRKQAGVLSAGDFEPMAAAVGAALQALDLQASALQYTPGKLILQGISGTHEHAMNQHLAASGYRADMQADAMHIQEIQ